MLAVDGVQFEGRHTTLLAPTCLQVERGQLLLVQGETQIERTTLSLVLSGRLKPNSGRISWDGHTRTRDVRRASALIDSPGVNDPEPHVRVKDLVKEDLALIPSFTWSRVRPMAWLRDFHLADLADHYVAQLSPTDRLDLMVHLAVADPAVRLLVCDSPERHGATDREWLQRLSRIITESEREVAVIAVVSVIPEDWTGPTAHIGHSGRVLEEDDA